MKTVIDELEKLGFIEIGNWILTDNGIRLEPVKDSFDRMKDKRGIYAFILETSGAPISYEIKYFGAAETHDRKLADRLKRYVSSNKGSTKARREKIIDALKEGYMVKVYAFTPNAELQSKYKYKLLNVDLVRGLEYNLIGKLKTYENGWNKKY